MKNLGIIVSREAPGDKKRTLIDQYSEFAGNFIFIPNDKNIILSTIREFPGISYVLFIESHVNGNMPNVNDFARLVKKNNIHNKVICYDIEKPIEFANLDGFIKLTSFQNDLKKIIEMVN
jgi:hypothetical protein